MRNLISCLEIHCYIYFPTTGKISLTTKVVRKQVLLQENVMSFGLCNSPATFERLKENIKDIEHIALEKVSDIS